MLWTRLDTETDGGRFWPVFLEWKTRQWPHHEQVNLDNATIRGLSDSEAYIYDPNILPVVFRNIAREEFAEVEFAIELRSSGVRGRGRRGSHHYVGI